LAERSIRIESPKKPKKKPIRTLTIVISVLAVLLIGCGIFICANVSQIWDKPGGDANGEEYETDPDASGLPDASYNGGTAPVLDKGQGVTDIMLIGVDNRESGQFSGRSDVMMFLRVDKNKGTIKLASFMRDTLVPIEGHGKNKLNAAYSFGGIDLAKQTYKDAFGLVPDYFITVNFYGKEDIIEDLGGVDVNIESDELEWLNININEINNEDSGKRIDTEDERIGKNP
jgi:LCP family protein required for cell wall assembly